ncbi:MAG: hypothetical protein R2724_34700 [Bryobacterales bacterium]
MRTETLALLLVAACHGEADPCAPCASRRCEPGLAIGDGTDGYAPIADGGEVVLVHGPQGGFHVEVGLLATHLDVSTLVTGHLAATVDGEELARVDPWLDFQCGADGLEAVGARLVYAGTPETLVGRRTRITARVVDLAGTVVEAEGTYGIVDGPAAQ